MIVFSVDTVGGGVQVAWINVFSSFEVWVTPVFATPPQAIVWSSGLVIDQLPIICPLVAVFAINRTPLKASLVAEVLTVTITKKIILSKKNI